MIYTHTANTNLVVTLAELKEHLRVENSYTTEDTLITSYIKAATAHAETYCNRFFLDTAITAFYDQFPTEQLQLYKGKVSEITAITYKDNDSASQTWASSKYSSDIHSMPARIKPNLSESFPDTDGSMNNVSVQYKVGWASASDVPEDIKTAIKLITARLYLVREDSAHKLLSAAQNYLNPFRLNYL